MQRSSIAFWAGAAIFLIATLLMTQFIPAAMLIIPLFIIFKEIGLLNTLLGLVLVNTTFELPLTAILMRGFISPLGRVTLSKQLVIRDSASKKVLLKEPLARLQKAWEGSNR